MTSQLIIFDTTLRDGEQSPGAAMTKEEKIRVARQLERLGVDVIEAGFAAASPGDFEAISSIAEIIKESTVCSLARANEKDVRRAGEAIKAARRGRGQGRRGRRIGFRAGAPLSGGGRVAVWAAAPADGRHALWTLTPSGAPAMECEITADAG